VVLVLCVVVGLVLSERQCKEDSKRLTQLVKNITDHISDTIVAEKLEMEMFHANSTQSRDILEAQLVKSATSVRAQKAVVDHTSMRLLEITAHIARLGEEHLNIQISSSELLEQCGRNAKLFESKITEVSERLSLVSYLAGFLKAASLEDTRVLAQALQVFSTLQSTPTAPAITPKTKSTVAQLLQIQTALAEDAGKDRISALIDQLIQIFQDEKTSIETEKQVASMRCRDEFDFLSFKLAQNENRTVEAHQDFEDTTKQNEQNKLKLTVLEAEFDVVNRAFQDKTQIIAQVSEASASHNAALTAQYEPLSSLLHQSLCCMCNEILTN
jgi:hypothetical protein